MKTKHLKLWVCALSAIFVAAATQAQPEFRVYDVSDILPEEVRELKAGSTTERVPPTEIATDIADMVDVRRVILGPGLIGIVAEADRHELFAAAIDTLHDAYHSRALLRVAVYEIGQENHASVGGAFAPDADALPVRQVQQSVFRRVPTRMHSTTSRRIISDVNIVTGTGGTGFEPQTENIVEGMSFIVRVDDASVAGHTLISFSGELTMVELRREEMKGIINPPSAGAGQAVGPVDLPIINQRLIQSAIAAADGVETVVAVVDRPNSDARWVLTATVTSAD